MAQPSSLDLAREAQVSSDIVRYAAECEKWDDWDKPAEPFRIYGSTFYVGTCGIAAILIADPRGHILIDSGTEAGAQVVLNNIRKLGFEPDDIVFLLHSHEHFDHVGGHFLIAEQMGGMVVASTASAPVLTTGRDDPRDPQAGLHDPMRPVEVGRIVANNDTLEVGSHSLRVIETPGHSYGALSWVWDTCDRSEGCKTIVYADSLSPISRDGYRFSDHPRYVANFRAGIERLAALECDILLTPHPSHSLMVERAASGTFLNGPSCSEYAQGKMRGLDARLEREIGGDE